VSAEAWYAVAGLAFLAMIGALVYGWREAGRQLREMEQFDQRKAGIDRAQRVAPVAHLRRLK
jgi:hypothetical protein